jgi:hypothetical protein
VQSCAGRELSLAEDPKWELAILATVQGFSEKLLQQFVEGEVPVPAGLETVSLQSDEGDVHQTLSLMRRWLRLLDLAISPAMLRMGLTPDTDAEIAEALLRYFSRKKDTSPVHRDKVDLVATFLYRHPRVPGQWERRGFGLDGSIPLSPFEIALIEILAEAEVPSLPEEHVQLLRRFETLRQEAEGFHDLSAMMESGIITRVRELKRSFEGSFYHPGVLATIAPYNVAFGNKFDELFRSAAGEIRTFAETLQEYGGTILGNVDGVDVTVEHIAALEENELLKMDYSAALDKFRRVSRLKRTLALRPPMRRAGTPPAPLGGKPVARPQSAASAARPVVDLDASRRAVTPQQLSAEETKLLKVEESVRVFVRVADPMFRRIVPMRFFNLMLSSPEADAFSADYLSEKSLRANAGRTMLRLVALVARLTTEMEELKRAQNSPSLWKLHADSAVVLLEVARAATENASRVIAQAGKDQEPDLGNNVAASLDKLRDAVDLAARTLSANSDEKRVGASVAG